MKKEIIISLRFEAVHNWADCPLFDVEFLKSPHRHLFYITCAKEVSHNDRDIEIIMFKRSVEMYLTSTYPTKNIGEKSCEMLAEELLTYFRLSSCTVLEDNENGARISI